MRRAVNAKPGRASAVWLAALPFVLLVAIYLAFSAARLSENPEDKLLPSFAALGDSIVRLATVPDRRTGDLVLWTDTAASLSRLAVGVAGAALIGLTLGVAIGLIPYVRTSLSPLVAVISLIPPMAILPILFVVLGLGEAAKIALIVLGVAPCLARDMALHVAAIPQEQIVKAQTLGASTWQIVLRVALPHALPRLVELVRLSLGPAWLFLIAAEAIASDVGLGYRIFLMRRYLAMDVILPYVAWLTFLAYVFDWALARLSLRAFPWLRAGRSAA